MANYHITPPPLKSLIALPKFLQRVIELSKQHLRHMAVGFDSPKVKVHIQNGVEFMNGRKESFDVIITDSCDPIGEAQFRTGDFNLCVYGLVLQGQLRICLRNLISVRSGTL